MVTEKKTYGNKDRQPFFLNLQSLALRNANSTLSISFRDGYPRFVISKNDRVSGKYMDNNIFIRLDGMMLDYIASLIRDVANNIRSDEEVLCLYGYDSEGKKVDVNVVDGTIRIYKSEDGSIWLAFTHYGEVFKYVLKPDKAWFTIKSNGIDITDKPSVSKKYASSYANILGALVTDAAVSSSKHYHDTK